MSEYHVALQIIKEETDLADPSKVHLDGNIREEKNKILIVDDEPFNHVVI